MTKMQSRTSSLYLKAPFSQAQLTLTQLSGHKNLKSIDEYSAVSEEQQNNMSYKISGRSSSIKPICKTTSTATV